MAEADLFLSKHQGASDVAPSARVVAPADGVDLAVGGQYPTAFYLNLDNAGDFSFVDVHGNPVTYKLEAGWHPLRVKEIASTNTLATSVLLAYQVHL